MFQMGKMYLLRSPDKYCALLRFEPCQHVFAACLVFAERFAGELSTKTRAHNIRPSAHRCCPLPQTPTQAKIACITSEKQPKSMHRVSSVLGQMFGEWFPIFSLAHPPASPWRLHVLGVAQEVPKAILRKRGWTSDQNRYGTILVGR